MSRRNVTLEIRARNALQRGLASAGKQLQAFGAGVVRIGKMAAKAFLGMGTALVGFGVIALRYFARQEKAEKELATALELHGDAVDALLPKYKKMASAIQDQTGVGDELTLSRMAALRMYGVEEKKLGDAAKAMIALTRAGMGEEGAQRALAMAAKGNFDMLNRYIPALRMAKTETEKVAAVNDFLTLQYAGQKRDLDTVTGAWAAFKGRVGDLWEEFGNLINRAVDIPALLKRAGDAVKGFGQTIRNWVESDRFQQLKATIEGVLGALKQGGEARAAMAGAMMEVVRSGFAVAAERVVSILTDAAPRIGKLIGGAARAAVESMKPTGLPGMKGWDKAAADLGMEPEKVGKPFGIVITKWTKEQRELVKQQIQINRQAKIFAELGIEATGAVEGQTAAETRLDRAMQALTATASKYRQEREDAADVTEDDIEPVSLAEAGAVDSAEQIEALKKRQIDLTEELAEAERRRAKDALDGVRAEMRERERMAQKTVAGYLDEIRRRRQAERQWERDKARAERLRGRGEQGAIDFVAAVDAIKEAREAVPEMQRREADLMRQIEESQKQTRTLETMADELKAVHADLQQLLAAG